MRLNALGPASMNDAARAWLQSLSGALGVGRVAAS